MKKNLLFSLWLVVVLLTSAALAPSRAALAQPGVDEPTPAPRALQAAEGGRLSRPVIYYADKENVDFYQPAAAQTRAGLQAANAAAATIIVQAVAAGAKNMYGDTCEAFPAQALAAFQYAADQWALLLNASVPITVQACWWNYNNSSILGYGGYYVQSPGAWAPVPNTEFAQALANTLAGTDLNGISKPEIGIAINKNFPYYYFVDMPPPGYYSLATVAMHEIGHGLGFSGSMEVFEDNGTLYGGWGSSATNYVYPIVYDRYGLDKNFSSLLNYPNESTALRDALLQQMYFDGPAAKASYGNQPVPLFSPNPWMPGSSYSHLAEIFNTYNGGINRLMTYSLGPQETNYNPGPVGMGVMADIGWPFPPTDITVTNAGILENKPIGTTAATLNTTDINTLGETYTYTIVGGADASMFIIQGNMLKSNSTTIDYETKTSLTVRVRTTDRYGLFYEEDLIIPVFNDPPTKVMAFPLIPLNIGVGQTFGLLGTDETDPTHTVVYSLPVGVFDNDKVDIEGNRFKANALTPKASEETITVQVVATDKFGETATGIFTLTVANPELLFLPMINR